MSGHGDPVVVFEGTNEFEAQAARDVLRAAGVPDLHLPSLSTGIFGVRHSSRVAVPRGWEEQAVQALADAGMDSEPQEPARGMDEFAETFARHIPNKTPNLAGDSHLRWVLIVVGSTIVGLIAWQLTRTG